MARDLSTQMRAFSLKNTSTHIEKAFMFFLSSTRREKLDPLVEEPKNFTLINTPSSLEDPSDDQQSSNNPLVFKDPALNDLQTSAVLSTVSLIDNIDSIKAVIVDKSVQPDLASVFLGVENIKKEITKSNGPVNARHRSKKPNTDQVSNSNTSATPKKTIYNYLVESDNLRRQQQEQLIKNQIDKAKKSEPVELINQSSVYSTNDETKSIQSNQNNPGRTRRRGRTQQNLKQSSPKPNKPKRLSKCGNNQATESSIASSSSSSSLANHQSRASVNQANLSAYINDLFANKTRQQIEQIFSTNALFHSPSSLLTKLDLKSLFQSSIFEALPRQSQLKLIKLLPECDRQLDSQGSFKLSVGALNNEFIKKCCIEWQSKLAQGEFGNFSLNQFYSSGNCYDSYENSLLNKSTTITRSTRLKQEKILQNLRDQNESSEEEFFFYDDQDSSLEDTSESKIVDSIDFNSDLGKQEAFNNELAESFEPTGKDKDESIYESASSSKPSSVKSSSSDSEEDTFQSSKPVENCDDLSDSEDSSASSDKTYSGNSSSVSLIEEDLEAKRRQLRKKAKRLLKKNKKLRENFKITADCMIANIKDSNIRSSKESDESFRSESEGKNQAQGPQPVRKSLRKRQTSRKFNDQDYTLNIDDLHSASNTSLVSPNTDRKSGKSKRPIKTEPSIDSVKNEPNFNVSLEAEQKGELKLRIKRIVSGSSQAQGASTILTSLINSPSESTIPNKIEFAADDRNSLDSCETLNDERRSRRKRNPSDLNQETGSLYKGIFLYSNNGSEHGDSIGEHDSLNQLMMISSPLNNTDMGVSGVTKNQRLKNPTSKSFNYSPTSTSSIFSDVTGLNSSPILSPSASPMTRSAAAKLKQQNMLVPGSNQSTLIDAKLLPPPPPLPVPPQNLFNDEENDDECPVLPLEVKLPVVSEKPDSFKPKYESTSCRTLAQIKAQLAEKKRKSGEEFTDEVKRSKLIDPDWQSNPNNLDSYTSNIQKIVHELKSIGNGSTVTESTSDLRLINDEHSAQIVELINESSKKKIVVDDFLNITPNALNFEGSGNISSNNEVKTSSCETNGSNSGATESSSSGRRNGSQSSQNPGDNENNNNNNNNRNNNSSSNSGIGLTNTYNIDLTTVIKQHQQQLKELEKRKEESISFLIDTSLLDESINVDGFAFSEESRSDKPCLVDLPNVGTFFGKNFKYDEHFGHKSSDPRLHTNIQIKKTQPLPYQNQAVGMNQTIPNMMPSSPMMSPVSASNQMMHNSIQMRSPHMPHPQQPPTPKLIQSPMAPNSSPNYISNHQRMTSNPVTPQNMAHIQSQPQTPIMNNCPPINSSPFKQPMTNSPQQYQINQYQSPPSSYPAANNYQPYPKYTSPPQLNYPIQQPVQHMQQAQQHSPVVYPGYSNQPPQSPHIMNQSTGSVPMAPIYGQTSIPQYQNHNVSSHSYQYHSSNIMSPAQNQPHIGQYPQVQQMSQYQTYSMPSKPANQYVQPAQQSAQIQQQVQSQPQPQQNTQNFNQNQQMVVVQPSSTSSTNNNGHNSSNNGKFSYPTAQNQVNNPSSMTMSNQNSPNPKQPQSPAKLNYQSNQQSSLNVAIPSGSSTGATGSNPPSASTTTANTSSSVSPTPGSQTTTPTKSKRSNKEKSSNGSNSAAQSSVTANTAGSTNSSTASNGGNQSQSRGQRTTQHQLTVAQLLSQKHQQQQQNQIDNKGQDSQQSKSLSSSPITVNSSRVLTSPLTVPSNQSSNGDSSSDTNGSSQTSSSNSAAKLVKLTIHPSFQQISTNQQSSDIPSQVLNNTEPEQSTANKNPPTPAKQNIVTTLKTSSTNQSPQIVQTIQNNGSASSALYVRNVTSQTIQTPGNNNNTGFTVCNTSLASSQGSNTLINKSLGQQITTLNNTTIKKISTTNSAAPTTTTISIPTSLSQSAKLILSNNLIGTSTLNGTKVIQQAIPLNNTNVLSYGQKTGTEDNGDQAVGKPSTEPSREESNEPNVSESKTKSQNDHKCLSSRAMVECDKCGSFSHNDCLVVKTKDDGNSEKLCSSCSNRENNDGEKEDTNDLSSNKTGNSG